MSELGSQNARRLTEDAPDSRAARHEPYRRVTPHVTQPPIDDVETTYATINRYETLDQRRSVGRRHVGAATADPQYLPMTDFQKRREQAAARKAEASRVASGAAANPGKNKNLHYDRYLQTPKSGKPIFTSPQARKRQRMRFFIAALLVLLIILALIWFIFLR